MDRSASLSARLLSRKLFAIHRPSFFPTVLFVQLPILEVVASGSSSRMAKGRRQLAGAVSADSEVTYFWPSAPGWTPRWG